MPCGRVISLAAVLCALTAPPAALAHHARDAVMLEGTLVVSHSDDFARRGSRLYYALDTGARRVKVDFGARRPALAGGTRVRLHGSLAGRRLLVKDWRRLGRAANRSLATTSAGPRRVAVILFNFSNDTGRPFSPAQVASTMFTGAPSVNGYFQEQSFGAVSLSGDVLGWYTLPTTNARCAVDSWAQAANTAAALAGANLAAYDNLVYVFPYASSCGWAGMAEMPGRRLWVNGSFTVRVVGHEFSHNLGVHHAGSLRCAAGRVRVAIGPTCARNEYGDPFDIMGASALRHTSSFHKAQLAWLAGAATQTVTNSGRYAIAPQEVAGAGVQALRIARGASGTYWYLEMRRVFGRYYDSFSPSDPAVNGVSIRLAPDYASREVSYLVDTTPSTTAYADAPLASGRTFSDSAYGITIKTTSVSPAGATVEITLGAASSPQPVAATPPKNVSLPVVARSPRGRGTLNASPGNWTGGTAMTFAYRWLRCDKAGRCSAIAGATRSSYRVRSADGSYRVRVAVTAQNRYGAARALSRAMAAFPRAVKSPGRRR